MMDKRELVAILGFDPDELNTPEMDLRRFGFYDDGGDEQAKHTGESPDTQAQGSGVAYLTPVKPRHKAACRAVHRGTDR